MTRTDTYGEIVVHHPNVKKGDSGFSISYIYGGWMPGVFDSVESAIIGGQCCFIDESRFVNKVQQPINHVDRGNREITIDDMKDF